MNPMEFFKKASDQRKQINEERLSGFMEDTAPSAEDILPILSPKQKKAMDDQNLLLSYVAKKLGINPYAISRDKNGHALILELKYLDNSNYPELYCYALGLNTETNKVAVYCIGKNTFKFTRSYGYIWPENITPPPTNLHINVLSTHPGFDGMGVGRVLMQATENIAVANRLKTMSLKQEICYVPNSQMLAKIDKVTTLLKDKDEYFKRVYFDKNMYFYYSNGFELDTSNEYFIEVPDGLNPLKKDRLQKVVLDYGFAKPLVPVSRTEPIFALKVTEDTATDTAKEYCYNNRFPTFLNNVEPENFSPITLKPNDDYTRFLYAFISTRKGKNVFIPTSANKRNFVRNLSAGHYVNQGYKFNQVCSTPEFIQLTLDDYEQATDYITNPIPEKPIIPLSEMLDILEDEQDSPLSSHLDSSYIEDDLHKQNEIRTYYKSTQPKPTDPEPQ